MQHTVALGQAHVARDGTDLTLVTWSSMVHTALAAAEQAAQQGVSVEVIDLRSIWPWDRELVFASAARTGRLLVAHEAVQAAGFGAEVAATVAEELGVPVRRVGAAAHSRRLCAHAGRCGAHFRARTAAGAESFREQRQPRAIHGLAHGSVIRLRS